MASRERSSLHNPAVHLILSPREDERDVTAQLSSPPQGYHDVYLCTMTQNNKIAFNWEKLRCSQISKSRSSSPLYVPYKKCSGNPEDWKNTAVATQNILHNGETAKDSSPRGSKSCVLIILLQEDLVLAIGLLLLSTHPQIILR